MGLLALVTTRAAAGWPARAGRGIDDIPKDTLEDACQLVKANSIQASQPGGRPDSAAVQAVRCGGGPAAGWALRWLAAVARTHRGYPDSSPCALRPAQLATPAVLPQLRLMRKVAGNIHPPTHQPTNPGCRGRQGNKMGNLAIVYTPASNLRKSADMAVGQVRRWVPCAAPLLRLAQQQPDGSFAARAK